MRAETPDSPADLPAVDPADFRQAVQIGEAVLDAGEEEETLERLGQAYAENLSDDPDEVLSLIVRFFALRGLLEGPELEPWMQPVGDDPETVDVADAVLYVAADEPLTDAGAFERDAFLERLRQIAPSG